MSSCNAYNHPPGCNCGWGGQWYTSGFRNYGGGLRNDTFRSTAAGEDFEFPYVTYPTYTIPNARCPLCPARVFFYQSPHGGRVFFDRLGPPWPKHSCTDKSAMRQHFSSAEGRSRFLTGATGQLSEPEPQVGGLRSEKLQLLQFARMSKITCRSKTHQHPRRQFVVRKRYGGRGAEVFSSPRQKGF